MYKKDLAKTIQIFLPGGDPTGIRIAELTTRIIQAIEVPRTLLQDFRVSKESERVGVYVLMGASEEGGLSIYIGQSGEIGKRLDQHNAKLDFWQRALIFISKTNNLTQTHALFLEWLCIQEAKNVGRCATINGNDGSKPYTPPPLEAECLEMLETTRILTAALGHRIFEPLVSQESEHQELFFCPRAGNAALGEYTSEGFVVLKGAKGKGTPTASFTSHHYFNLRQSLIDQGKAAIDDGFLVFKENVLFESPSAAAAVVCGSAANGWTEWKNKDGVTLGTLKRGPSLESS
ncbi:GIY-YIG nuclease family protein [Bordetella genomosp. 9]|uniref:DUF4357 domain-containing protein n=1 Tax=Bordetella genomosp. 9 TaxID=1416803 RepID=A0A1W6YW65_9BORD|nr:GIY-YIG nuclease family protein [Bordetella genomosp. 9]ARP85224.1 hypothetical protein CAL13_02575 [Bordetella genomosp. 9]